MLAVSYTHLDVYKRQMMMSAHPDAVKISENVGVDDFLSKPFEIDDLVKKVEKLLK